MGDKINWQDADLFDDPDAEVITYLDPEESLINQLDSLVPQAMSDADLAAWIRCEGIELTVAGYRRASLMHREIVGAARQGANLIHEALHDEGILDPEGWEKTRALGAELERAILADVVRVLRDHGGPWHCEKVSSHTYDAEEIIATLGLEAAGG